MSRIGKKPISIPDGISVAFDEQKGHVTVKGPKGQLDQTIGSGFKLNIQEKMVTIEALSNRQQTRALHGLYRSLIANMVTGVSVGYRRQLELIGVGYKAMAQNNVLELSIGYSHGIFMAIPSEIKVEAEMKKGSNPIITLEGIDKQLVGHIGAKIKSLRKKDPYKGKGIYYLGEPVRRKAGKTASK